jgi:hypothetical protein
MDELVAVLRRDALDRLASRSSQPSALAGSGSRRARPSSERPALRPSADRNIAPLQLMGVKYG